MFDPNSQAPEPNSESSAESPAENNESFEQVLSQYEQQHARKPEDMGKPIEATVIAVSAESVILDIGFKSEGLLPLSALAGEPVKAGDKLLVSVKGRGPEGYYELARGHVVRPTDWSALEKAFAERTPIAATVTAVVKGGVSVDVGVRAFMPASRSGARDAAELEKLVGQEIQCRIIKLDVADEDLVVDRRLVLEQEERAAKQRRLDQIREGDTVRGTVRSLMDYGAFIDLGGVDGLLHVGEISWARVNKPSDVLTVGQEIEARVLKIEPDRKRISLGLKQLEANPWGTAAEKYKIGERVRGTVSRLAEFGAFVELEPGVEGLIHMSEMSWSRKSRKPGDVVKPGETVEAVVLGVSTAERRLSLGLKQALGDPWNEVPERFPVGSVIHGPITSILKFGAFVQLAEGVEGMIHIGDISADKNLNHPQEVLKIGQDVRAQVLEIDTERRRLRLGMKQLVPTTVEEYIAEHKMGEVVTGRMVEINGNEARVELGEGVHGTCSLPAEAAAQAAPVTKAPAAKAASGKADLSSLGAMLQARWKGNASSGPAKPEPVRAGQIRQFRIVRLDPTAKKIELELAP